MLTKAVYLEAVSDLLTVSFIAAFKRFVARRGKCSRLISNNNTNFKDSDKEFHAMFDAASDFFREGRSQLAQDGTDWTFIPSSVPYFGGF